jgi:hypothetical protein
MTNTQDTSRARRIAMLTGMALVLLTLVCVIIEVVAYTNARTALEDAAAESLRYATTGQFNDARFQLLTETQYRNGNLDNPLDPEIISGDLVPCVEGDRRGDLNTFYPLPDDEAYRIHVYEGDIESLYATWYDGEDCDPNNEEHQARRVDIARLLSIITIGWDAAAQLTNGDDPLSDALNPAAIEHGVSEAVRMYLMHVWEVPLPASDKRGWFDLEVCSTRELLHPDSQTLLPDHNNRFLTVIDDHNIAVPHSVTQRYAVPYCLLNEIPPESVRVNNAGNRWLDAGAPGDTVTIIARYNHGLVTPLRFLVDFVRIETRQTGVNETFQSASTGGLSNITPTPSQTPMPTFTPTATAPVDMTAQAMQPTIMPTVVLDDAPTEVLNEVIPVPTPVGDGTFNVFAPQEIAQSDTVRIELELSVDDLFEGELGESNDDPPLPPGGNVATATAIAGVGNVDDSPRATFTPAPLRGAPPRTALDGVGESGVPVYERIGAEIRCAPERFSGCEDGVYVREVNLDTRVETWTWILVPREGVEGWQDVYIETFWIEGIRDGEPLFRELSGPYRFRINVTAGTGTSPLVIPAAAAVIAIVALGVYLAVHRDNPSAFSAKSATPPIAPQDQPHVFISYRRGLSWSLARSIANSLAERGADVFLDVDDINEGRFAEIIEESIRRCDYFIPILAPGTLDSVWVRREIQAALALKKTIIPLLSDGFTMDASSIPADVREIASHNAITIVPEFYDAVIERLARRFLKLDGE